MSVPAIIDIYPASALYSVEELRVPLESAIRRPIADEIVEEEVEEVLASVEASRLGQSDRYYAVALNAGNRAIGLMGLQPPTKEMLEYTDSPSPIEVVNAFVMSTERGAGIGRKLLSHLESRAIELGHTEIIVNSGPRYEESGWPFWQSMFGDHVAVAPGYYDSKYDAMVWRKSLTDKE